MENNAQLPAIQVPPDQRSLQNSAPIQQPAVIMENHALDPANNNILPLEGALVPYQPAPNEPQNTDKDTPQFDLLTMLGDLENDDSFDQQMVLAATQVEQNIRKQQ